MGWWIWLVGGILLLLAEILTPGGFYFLFFGIGALVTALATFWGAESLLVQMVLFGVVSVGALLGLRNRLLQKSRVGEHIVDSLVGEVATVQTTLHPGDYGQAELRGTTWKVRNVGSLALQAGQRSVVEQVDGLTLLVRAES